VLQAGLSALTFITVLWTIGGALTIVVGQTAITIPGFLVIAAAIYAAVASGTGKSTLVRAIAGLWP
jgi:vitamin B12/bleomycin/antimicrobial peptide transport system ATP-binding/permease protein